MSKRLLSTIACAFLAPALASAHAFGQKYTLPLPVWLYVFGGGAAIIVSFAVIGLFSTQAYPSVLEKQVDLSRRRFFAALSGPRAITAARIAGFLLLVLTLAAGVFGTQNPNQNFAPTFFWILFLLGFTYASAIVGNVWEALNPWKSLARWIADYKPLLEYPRALGYAPALALYVCLIWLELLSGGAAVRPEGLAICLGAYTALTLAGVVVYGRDAWFMYGDFFSVFFRLISKLSPLTFAHGRLVLRWPLVGLLEESADRMSLVYFIIFMLSSTAFDGFRETIKSAQLAHLLSFLGSEQAIQLAMLFGTFGVFLGLYIGAIGMMQAITQSPLGVRHLALLFAYSLIPIALAYNLAHYYTLVLVQGQSIIPALSDPFSLGWNLFGTSGYVVNVGIVGAKTVWQLQVAFILAGHIGALYVAHLQALRVFQAHKDAVLSQLPMLLVMVAYTMAGLWILSQPLTLGS